MKTALITGITGQDGAYLSELLLKKGYRSGWSVAQQRQPQYHKTGIIWALPAEITFDSCDMLDITRYQSISSISTARMKSIISPPKVLSVRIF